MVRHNDFNPNRSLDFGEIARLCQAACFSPSRRRSGLRRGVARNRMRTEAGLRRGVARNRMRTEAGKMPESLIFLTENSPGVSNDRFGFKSLFWHITMRSDLDGIKLCQGRFFYTGSLRILPFAFACTMADDYQEIFHSSIRRVLAEKPTPILKICRGSAAKGLA